VDVPQVQHRARHSPRSHRRHDDQVRRSPWTTIVTATPFRSSAPRPASPWIRWQLQDSDDNSSFGAVDASLVLFTLPKTTSNTSKVFHAGYIGKRRYVKAAFTSGGAETGQISALLGHGMSKPVWQDAYADMV
jgi:hypothetical protein